VGTGWEASNVESALKRSQRDLSGFVNETGLEEGKTKRIDNEQDWYLIEKRIRVVNGKWFPTHPSPSFTINFAYPCFYPTISLLSLFTLVYSYSARVVTFQAKPCKIPLKGCKMNVNTLSLFFVSRESTKSEAWTCSDFSARLLRRLDQVVWHP